MGWVSGTVTFLVIWWIVFFMVLPWGVQRDEDPETGHDAGAPVRPRIFTKMAITTGIAIVLFALAWLAIDSGLISFRETVAS